MTQRSWPENATAVVLASRPTGMVRPQNFAVTSRPVVAPADGQVLVRTIITSVEAKPTRTYVAVGFETLKAADAAYRDLAARDELLGQPRATVRIALTESTRMH
jgi:hypothetical protein